MSQGYELVDLPEVVVENNTNDESILIKEVNEVDEKNDRSETNEENKRNEVDEINNLLNPSLDNPTTESLNDLLDTPDLPNREPTLDDLLDDKKKQKIKEATEEITKWIKDKIEIFNPLKKLLDDQNIKKALADGNVDYLLNSGKMQDALSKLPLKDKKELVKMVKKLEALKTSIVKPDSDIEYKGILVKGNRQVKIVESYSLEGLTIKPVKNYFVGYKENSPKNRKASKLAGFNVGGDVIFYMKDRDIMVKDL